MRIGIRERRRLIGAAASVALATVAAIGMSTGHAPIASAKSIGISAEYLETATTNAAPARAAAVRTVSGKRSDLLNLQHPRVDRWVRAFTTDQRRSFATYLDRKDRYDDMILAKLARRSMPASLVYLPMIESGYNPRARSPVKASGMWQFMTATAKRFGLKVNRRVDERANPARSTDAALKYLDYLYDRFGSWYLAAAAYNGGEGRVSKALKQVTGRTRGTDADFYRISHRLPQETRDYVPKLIAAARIGNNPRKYGFD